jgi:hypothetical protein
LALGGGLALNALLWPWAWTQLSHHRQVRSAAQVVPRAGGQPAAGAVTTPPALQAFERVLVPHADASNVMLDILEEAHRRALDVGGGAYAQAWDADGHFGRQDARLHFSGEAVAVRDLVNGMLEAQPALGVQHLVLQKEASGLVSAQIDWVLFTQDLGASSSGGAR